MLELAKIDEEIAKLELEGRTTYDTCRRLADLYNVRDKLIEKNYMGDSRFSGYPQGDYNTRRDVTSYNGIPQGSMPIRADVSIGVTRNSDFMLATKRANMDDVMYILDEYMTKVKTLHPREYDEVMAKIYNLHG